MWCKSVAMSGDFEYADQYTTKQKPPRSVVQEGGEEPLGTQPRRSGYARTSDRDARANKAFLARPQAGELDSVRR